MNVEKAMKVSSLRNYFSVSVTARETKQTCQLCMFPQEVVKYLVAQVKQMMRDEFNAADPVLDSYVLEDDASRPVSEKTINHETYLRVLNLKLGLLSLMSSCYALYSKTRGCFSTHLDDFAKLLTEQYFFRNNETILSMEPSGFDERQSESKNTASVVLYHLTTLVNPDWKTNEPSAEQLAIDSNVEREMKRETSGATASENKSEQLVEGYIQTGKRVYNFVNYELIPVHSVPGRHANYHRVDTSTPTPLFKITSVNLLLYANTTSDLVESDPALADAVKLKQEEWSEDTKISTDIFKKIAFLTKNLFDQPTATALDYYYRPEFLSVPGLQLVFREEVYFFWSEDRSNGHVDTVSALSDEKEFQTLLARKWNPRMEYMREFEFKYNRCGIGENGGLEALAMDGGCCGEVVSRLVDSICVGADEQVRARIVARVSEACLAPPGMSDTQLTSMILEQYNELQ